MTSHFPNRCFAFDQFGPLSIRPRHGSSWAPRVEAGPAAGDLPPHARHPLLPRLLQPRRRPALGREPPPQGRRPHPGRAQVDPGRPPGRRPDLRHPGQPVGEQDPRDPGLGRAQQGRAVLHPDQRVLGQPDRGPVRAAAHLHHGRLEPPQPHRRWPASCRPTCAGATPTPATPTSSPPNAANAPASAANANNAGADHERHDPVNVHGQRTSRSATAVARAGNSVAGSRVRGHHPPPTTSSAVDEGENASRTRGCMAATRGCEMSRR